MFSKCIAQSLFNIISSLISSLVQLVILKFKRLFGKRSLLSPFTGIVFPPQKASKTTILRVSVFRPLLYCSEWPFQATTRWKNPSSVPSTVEKTLFLIFTLVLERTGNWTPGDCPDHPPIIGLACVIIMI